MDGTPHIHDVRVESYDLPYSWGQWQVTYGDTHIKLADRDDDPYNWPTDRLQKKVAEKAKEAVIKHDRGSVIALQQQNERDQKINAVRDVLGSFHSMLSDPSRWGGDQLR